MVLRFLMSLGCPRTLGGWRTAKCEQVTPPLTG